jgi:hypothetical protein
MKPDREAGLALRQALCELPDVSAQEGLTPPGPGELYVPESHTKALNLDTTVVVGMRGAGKSVWTAALFDDAARQRLVGAGAPKTLEDTHVRVGFSNDPYQGGHPDSESLGMLLDRGLEPRHIWRGVLARQLADVCGLPFSSNRFDQAAQWAREDPESFNELLGKAATSLKQNGRYLLLIFDSLDTTVPGSWKDVRALARGALEVALACRPYPNIRLKFFIRPDMEEDEGVFDFRDSSKLRHNRVDLVWRPVDLYGLLFHTLANGSAGDHFRQLAERITRLRWESADGFWRAPDAMRGNEENQRPILEAIAGPYMGTNPRRGYTYTWITGHLADANGRIAPRSLLLALRKAAGITYEKHSAHDHPLHYEAIKRGVAEASEIRVDELSREDYPWVAPLLRQLHGMTVPLEIRELAEKWTASVLDEVLRVSNEKLPPRRYVSALENGPSIELLIGDLEALGVLYRTEDGRINIPDIFRVGFGIRRKGGVRPPR